jgi:hypothetical protein
MREPRRTERELPERLPGWVAFWIVVVFGVLGMLSAAILPHPHRSGPSASPQVPPTGGAAMRDLPRR